MYFLKSCQYSLSSLQQANRKVGHLEGKRVYKHVRFRPLIFPVESRPIPAPAFVRVRAGCLSSRRRILFDKPQRLHTQAQLPRQGTQLDALSIQRVFSSRKQVAAAPDGNVVRVPPPEKNLWAHSSLARAPTFSRNLLVRLAVDQQNAQTEFPLYKLARHIFLQQVDISWVKGSIVQWL